MIQNYVLGFPFNCTSETIALILKNKPDWQAGKYNGVGGKIEPMETPRQAMVREFAEECGVETKRWTKRGMMLFDQAHVHVFSVILTAYDLEAALAQMTDEAIGVFEINDLPPNRISNLDWLIPICLEVEHTAYFETRFGDIVR